MDKILYFDICSIIILIILIISTLFRHMIRGRINRYFFALLVITLVTACTDVWGIYLEINYSGNSGMLLAIKTTYLILFMYCTPVLLTYLTALTDTWHVVRKYNIVSFLLSLPFMVSVVLLIENLFTHNVFYFGSNGEMIYEPAFSIMYLGNLLYYIAAFCYIIYFYKLFTAKRLAALVAVFPVLIFASIYQMIYHDMATEIFCTTVCLMFLSLMIQRPEEILDIETGLKNLPVYVSDINRAVMTNKPNRIIMLNITNFHTVRRMIGYENTSILLKSIANKLLDLNQTMKLNSDIYYLGDGKFRIVMNSSLSEKAERAAELINNSLKPNVVAGPLEVHLIGCVCIANCPADIPDAESLIAFGNVLNEKYYTGEVLYASEIYNKSRFDIMKDIDSIIEYAMAHNQFHVYYQPIYSVEDNCFNSAEALLRLQLDDGSFISPDIFIPAAEKSGAIHKIGSFVLDQVCSFIASEEFRKLHLHYIEVNLSVIQCMQSSLAGEVLATMERYELDPSQLNLEITETAASYSQKTMLDNLNVLSGSGIALSLDDFGTGYSNMMRIASLPLRIVKLDKDFIYAANDTNMMVVLENTIHMIKEMNMKIVVEGIETQQLVDKFTNLKCEFIQGYFYSKPLPKDKFIEFVASKN